MSENQSKLNGQQSVLRRFLSEAADCGWLFFALVAYRIADWLDLSDKDYHDDL
ncbi:MAG TPA: hypothetical protein VMZ30_16865 [Pyrinomonadaceae bacterium]|nr:hypothetical protein [Pyrinomonadaceae bacterium]